MIMTDASLKLISGVILIFAELFGRVASLVKLYIYIYINLLNKLPRRLAGYVGQSIF